MTSFKKNLLNIALFVIVLSSANSQQYWREIPTPTKLRLNRLCFLDSLTGWIVGDSGIIIKTIDGGDSWTIQDSKTTYKIVDIFMLNRQRGWALAHNYETDTNTTTTILATTDGGSNWTVEVYPEKYVYFFSIVFLDSANGWMAGLEGKVMGTSDGGASWFEAIIDPQSQRFEWDLYRIKFLSPQRGFAVGGRFDVTSVVWNTTNGGETWWSRQISGEPLYDIYFSDSLNGLGVGGDLEFGASLVRTSNGGADWVYQYLGFFGQARAITFRTAAESWVPLVFSGTYLYTLDSGHTWNSYYTTHRKIMYDATFTDPKTGYMVGDSGVVMKYNYFANNISLAHRWNLVSLPLSVTNPRKDLLFPTATSDAFAFTDQGYEPKDTLVNGLGYWMKFLSDQTVEIEGFPRLSDTFFVKKGWNLIGSISYPIPVTSIVTDPPNILTSLFFGYENGYFRADTIQPGRGYWIAVNSDGRLIVNAPVSAPQPSGRLQSKGKE
ncbi:MAG TPA: hypothetical protein VFF29_05210 [Bacteroidota bacterium]|nr:hypothetical protein [Bacteroidota bacterium]